MLGDLQGKTMKAGLRALQGDAAGFDELVRIGVFVVGTGLAAAVLWSFLFPPKNAPEESS